MSDRRAERRSQPDRLLGQAQRRGVLIPGDRVQITDPKGKLYTIVLVPGGRFQTKRGFINHDDLLGKPDGQVVRTKSGASFQVFRPLLADYVLSMPRGAAIVYPKDAAQIIQMGDIFPGAKVLEAGVGSGALTLSLLGAIGTEGELLSVELREDFASIAEANVDLWFHGRHPAWTLQVADVNEVAASLTPHSIDRVVLDMLDPWVVVREAARILTAGGVITCYVATVPQMSRLVEELRETERYAEPQVWESVIRPWHVEGLAVRPEHRMVAHTGFLVTARRLSEGVEPHEVRRRPANAASGKPGMWAAEPNWEHSRLGLRTQSVKKTRRVRRDLDARVEQWLTK